MDIGSWTEKEFLIVAVIGLGVGFGIPAVLIANLFFHFLPTN